MGSASNRIVASWVRSVLLLIVFPVLVPGAVRADEATDRRIAQLEKRLEPVPGPVEQHGSDGGVLFLFGAFCALWAQNTNRNAWLWFFLGLIFSVITVLVLLVKNAEDRKRKWRAETGDFDAG